MRNLKAFSFVELIITVTIIVLLSVIWFNVNNSYKNKSDNTRIIADLGTIATSLGAFKIENSSPLLPEWNKNFFSSSWTYVHIDKYLSNINDNNAYWVYGQFTENLLSKRYLDAIPLDPRTSQYYSYWVKLNDWSYDIAWVIFEDNSYKAKIESDYDWREWIYSLIREFNWPNFVRDWYEFLPYNPQERILVARASNWKIYKKWDTIINDTQDNLEIFFSDGSVSVISQWTEVKLQELDFPQESRLVSKIELFLLAWWSIWTKATSLEEGSSFNIRTWDITASVRWTIFGVDTMETPTRVYVIEWEVEVTWTTALGWTYDMLPQFSTPNYRITPVAGRSEPGEINSYLSLLEYEKGISAELSSSGAWVDSGGYGEWIPNLTPFLEPYCTEIWYEPIDDTCKPCNSKPTNSSYTTEWSCDYECNDGYSWDNLSCAIYKKEIVISSSTINYTNIIDDYEYLISTDFPPNNFYVTVKKWDEQNKCSLSSIYNWDKIIIEINTENNTCNIEKK